MTRFMLDINGFIAVTNATNVFIVRKGDLATSKVVACPEGITRATVIEIAAAEQIRCVEADLSPGDVSVAEAMCCTGTMDELAGGAQIDHRVVGDGRPGPTTHRLSGRSSA